MEPVLQEIRAAIWAYNADKVRSGVETALAQNIDLLTIMNDGLVAGMNALGEKFKSGEVFLPEILVSARAMAAGMEILKPLMVQAGASEKGILVIGTVKDDLHDIGKNIVIAMFEGSGYRVVDLGISVSTERFLQAIEEHNADVVGIAALLTTTMENMRATTRNIKARYPAMKVIVGGAPVTQHFAEEIGADAYAPDAATAVDMANAFLAS